MKLFKTGQIVLSSEISNAVANDKKFAELVFSSLQKHIQKNGRKLLSTYETDEFRKIIILTAEDQSQTVVAFSQINLDGILYTAIGRQI